MLIRLLIRLPFPFEESGCRSMAIFNRCDMHDHLPRKLLDSFICKLSNLSFLNYFLCEFTPMLISTKRVYASLSRCPKMRNEWGLLQAPFQ